MKGQLPCRMDEYWLDGHQILIRLKQMGPLMCYAIFIDGEAKDDACYGNPYVRVRNLLGI